MARRQLKSDDVEGFVRAFWDEVRDIELRYECHVSLDIRLSEHRGEVKFVGTVTEEVENAAERLIAVTDRVFPSHRYTSLHALLYNLASALNVAVQRDYHERHGHFYSSPVD